MKKKLLILTLGLVLLLSVPVYADTEMSIEQAQSKMLEQDTSIEDLEDNLEDLWDGYNSALAGKRQIQKILDEMSRYEKLYERKYEDKETLSATDQMQLEIYQAMFGEEPPEYTPVEMFNSYIQPRDFPYYQLKVQYEQLKLTRDSIKPTLDKSVLELYVQVLNLQNTYNSQVVYYDFLKSQHNDLKNQYEQGVVSKVDYEKSERNLKASKLGNDQLKRNLDNLKMTFNNMLGLEITEDIILTDDYILDIPTLLEYEDYYFKALNARQEILTKKLSLEQYKREDRIIRQYFKHEEFSERIDADINLRSAQNDFKEAMNTVEKDVFSAYMNAKESYDQMILNEKKYINAKNTYSQQVEYNELGMINDSALKGSKFQLQMAKATYMNSIRTYKLAFEKLNYASTIGPGYSSSQGGF